MKGKRSGGFRLPYKKFYSNEIVSCVFHVRVLQGVCHKFIIAVLMEYIRSLNQFQITVQVKPIRAAPLVSQLPSAIDRLIVVSLQHYLYELVIKTLVQHNLFYMLHQFLQYHVLSDSKPLVSSRPNWTETRAEMK